MSIKRDKKTGRFALVSKKKIPKKNVAAKPEIKKSKVTVPIKKNKIAIKDKRSAPLKIVKKEIPKKKEAAKKASAKKGTKIIKLVPVKKAKASEVQRKALVITKDAKGKTLAPRVFKIEKASELPKKKTVKIVKQKPDKYKLNLPKKFKKDSYRKIVNKYKDSKGTVRLRNATGGFVSEKAQKIILSIAKTMDKEGIAYTYKSLLSIPEVEKKLVLFHAKTPKHLFYWNAQNLIDEEEVKKKGSFGSDRLSEAKVYEITDFAGVKHKTTSRAVATELMFSLSSQCDKLTDDLDELTGTNPYITVPTDIIEDSDGNVVKIMMDFSKADSSVKPEIFKREVSKIKSKTTSALKTYAKKHKNEKQKSEIKAEPKGPGLGAEKSGPKGPSKAGLVQRGAKKAKKKKKRS